MIGLRSSGNLCLTEVDPPPGPAMLYCCLAAEHYNLMSCWFLHLSLLIFFAEDFLACRVYELAAGYHMLQIGLWHGMANSYAHEYTTQFEK